MDLEMCYQEHNKWSGGCFFPMEPPFAVRTRTENQDVGKKRVMLQTSVLEVLQISYYGSNRWEKHQRQKTAAWSDTDLALIVMSAASLKL